jgi:alkanesulfonate monooxygenase SsuD/methylene tetrahydromethanopterin reductase-like flavin-dependent oxidoreductase (luciferase family)
VTVLAHVPVAFELAARNADVVFTTPKTADEARTIVNSIRTHEAAVFRQGPPLRVFADLVCFLDGHQARAEERKARLDEWDGRTYRSDAPVFVGTVSDLADLLEQWRSTGVDGFRLRPGSIPHDLDAIAHDLVALLQDRSLFRRRYEETTLRARLGLPRPSNRYAIA